MLTRTRSKSIDTISDTISETGSSQGTLERQSSTASSCFVDSQDSAPPRKSKSRGGTKPRPHEAPVTQWVMIMPECALSDDIPNNAHPQFISYPDPHTGFLRQYLLSANNKMIYEVNKNTNEYRSWFIGNTVQSDGTFYMCTQMDPLFLVLPVLIKAKFDKFTNLDTLLHSSSHSHLLEQLISSNQLTHITDTKVTRDGEIVYKYNQDKTMEWLALKVERLADTLKAQDIYVGKGSQSGHYVPSNKQSSITHDDYLSYASGMIGDYLPPELSEELIIKYGGQTTMTNNTKKHSLSQEEEEEDTQPSKKKFALSNGDPTEDYSKGYRQPIPVKTVSKMSRAQKALSEVNKKGMKKLSSFFSKK